MLSVVFPGQGAQKKGMLSDTLAAEFPHLLSTADQILGYSLRELCQHDPDGKLDRTDFTQPALYTVNALSYLRWIERGGECGGDCGGERYGNVPKFAPDFAPNFALGHSLGEYNALFAAGAFDFETGLRLVQKRGQLMSRVTGGAMAVVIGLRVADLSAVLEQHGLITIDLANLNAPLQTTISGLREELERARPLLEQAGARVLMLKVSGAFHSRHLRDTANEFKTFLDDFSFNPLRFPVISNVGAIPYSSEQFNQQLRDKLVRHLISPVRWVDSIRYVLQAGGDEFEEIGPGKTLTALITQIRRDNPPPAGASPHPASDLEPSVGHATPAPAASADNPAPGRINAADLGCRTFKRDYGLKYAYLAGSMYRGIASVELVARMGKAGMLGFFGTGGLTLGRIEEAILALRKELTGDQKFGMNLLCQLGQAEHEMRTVELFLRHGIQTIEASGYMQLTAALVRYRVAGLTPGAEGGVVARNKIIAKFSRPELARLFLAPPPETIVRALQENGQITELQARLAREISLADDLCVEADSAGHTDRRSATTLLPAIMHMRDEAMRERKHGKWVRVGLSGGIGTPEAAAAAFMMGAEFILTGSINQCTVEAGNSDAVKDLLEQMDVQDTDYAPAGDMFETGSQIQVLRKGLFFSARANRLHELYRQHESLEQIDGKTRQQIEQKYFGRSLEAVYEETRAYWLRVRPSEIDRAERDPKHKMALVFKWYFVHTMRLALHGSAQQKFDYQIHCGPALGAFNRWAKGTPLEHWRNRHVDEIAEKLMQETAEMLNMGYARLLNQASYK